jgi:CspA family cold shock protein
MYAAGPLRHSDSGVTAGGCWSVQADVAPTGVRFGRISAPFWQQACAIPCAFSEWYQVFVAFRLRPSRCNNAAAPQGHGAASSCAMGSRYNMNLGAADMTGTVKWYQPAKGYGFISPDGGGTDVFVERAALERTGLTMLEEGQRVTFEVLMDQRRNKPLAINVRVE